MAIHVPNPKAIVVIAASLILVIATMTKAIAQTGQENITWQLICTNGVQAPGFGGTGELDTGPDINGDPNGCSWAIAAPDWDNGVWTEFFNFYTPWFEFFSPASTIQYAASYRMNTESGLIFHGDNARQFCMDVGLQYTVDGVDQTRWFHKYLGGYGLPESPDPNVDYVYPPLLANEWHTPSNGYGLYESVTPTNGNATRARFIFRFNRSVCWTNPEQETPNPYFFYLDNLGIWANLVPTPTPLATSTLTPTPTSTPVDYQCFSFEDGTKQGWVDAEVGSWVYVICDGTGGHTGSCRVQFYNGEDWNEGMSYAVSSGKTVYRVDGYGCGSTNSRIVVEQEEMPVNSCYNWTYFNKVLTDPVSSPSYVTIWAFFNAWGSAYVDDICLYYLQVTTPTPTTTPPTPTSTPTSTPTPPTYEPTRTPTPTITPGGPTLTPPPTWTPRPTWTPVPTWTPPPTWTPDPACCPTCGCTPTWTPGPTWTPVPTWTPPPTWTPEYPPPTGTPDPTWTPVPTWTPAPTWTSEPTSAVPTWTPEPTWTPPPTWTPWPTQTGEPTHTPPPTWTPEPTWTPVPTWTPAPITVTIVISDTIIGEPPPGGGTFWDFMIALVEGLFGFLVALLQPITDILYFLMWLITYLLELVSKLLWPLWWAFEFLLTLITGLSDSAVNATPVEPLELGDYGEGYTFVYNVLQSTPFGVLMTIVNAVLWFVFIHWAFGQFSTL